MQNAPLTVRALEFFLETAVEQYVADHPGYARKLRRRMARKLAVAEATRPLRGLQVDPEHIADMKAALAHVEGVAISAHMELRRRA